MISLLEVTSLRHVISGICGGGPTWLTLAVKEQHPVNFFKHNHVMHHSSINLPTFSHSTAISSSEVASIAAQYYVLMAFPASPVAVAFTIVAAEGMK